MTLSAAEYKLLTEMSPVLIWRAGLDGRCNYFNQTWLAFTGRTLEDELGDGWLQSVHEEDLARCVQMYRAAVSLRSAFEIEYRLRRHDGEYRWVSHHVSPFDEGFVGSCIDVHERRMMDEAKTSFLALVAHELRTPLSALATYVQILESKTAGGIFSKMMAQVRRLSTLLTDLTDIASVEEGRPMDLKNDPVDLMRIVKREVDSLNRAVVFHGEPAIVRGDEKRLGQAVSNLLSNAVKYSPRKDPVQLTMSTSPDHVVVVVRDQGIGIPPEDLKRVTRRYYRATNAAVAHFGGLGLGLAITEEIVTAHGGTLSISSEVGKGTEVTLTLPRGEMAHDHVVDRR